MSTRHVRKIVGNDQVMVPDGPCDSDSDYEPLYTTSKFTFDGLELSSHSEEEHEPSESELVEEVEPESDTRKKKNNRKKRKQKRAKEAVQCEDEDDEIDKSVKEINELLGCPSASPQSQPPPVLVPDVLLVERKYMNAAAEMTKRFGPEPTEERNTRGNRREQRRIPKKIVIIVSPNEYKFEYKIFGLTMSMTRTEDGCAHFTFDHSKDYRRMHQRLLHLAAASRARGWQQNIDHTQGIIHVESLIEFGDMWFQLEDYDKANAKIERAIAYMQSIAHPLFQLADPRTRLSYTFVENRAFHVAILKYIYLLTNRACHRTALELAKTLLNLDPRDPLAVLLVIDTLALRAREHQWLIRAVDHWARERDAGYLFSMQYSYALAHFHVAKKNKERGLAGAGAPPPHAGTRSARPRRAREKADSNDRDTSKVDELLQAAMMRFPTVLLRLLECAPVKAGARHQTCALFSSIAETKITKNLKELILVYVKLSCSRWHEPDVLEWLQRNANELADKYNQDPETQARAKALAVEQLNLFRTWPDEVMRHLCVIKPMAQLLVDGALPQVANVLAADPSPRPFGVNRYGYTYELPTIASPPLSDIQLLIAAMLPTHGEVHPPYPHYCVNCLHLFAAVWAANFEFWLLRWDTIITENKLKSDQ